MSNKSARTESARYIAPPSQVFDQVARTVCRQLGETDARFQQAEVAHDFSTFLAIIARIQADHLNKVVDKENNGLLDTDKQAR